MRATTLGTISSSDRLLACHVTPNPFDRAEAG